jgi:ABC-type multidrug transport system permease subunit
MENNKVSENVNLLFEKAGDYVETRLDLMKMQAADKSADIISSLISKLIVLLILSIFFIIVNIGIALLAGEWLGKTYYGFFAVAAFYLIVGLIFHLMRHKWIKDPIGDKIVAKFFN